MALTLENANLVWQRVDIALGSLGCKKASRESLRQLKAYLAQEKRNPNLQFVAISDLAADAPIADAACKVYGVFLKKSATATGSFVKASDHATVSGTTAGDLTLELNAANAEALLVFPTGWAQTVGFAIGADTTADGSTPSTAGDGPNGFVILGAA